LTSKKVIKSAFESMLYVWGQLLPAKDAAEVFDISEQESHRLF
jgi:segregation and condensation protein B